MGQMQTENPDSKVIRPQPGKKIHNACYIKPLNLENRHRLGTHLLVFLLFLCPSLPFTGMCVKTLSESSNQKVFVNICQSNSVPPPPELAREELLELLQSEDPSSYRVPMSLGEPHTEMDNSM